MQKDPKKGSTAACVTFPGWFAGSFIVGIGGERRLLGEVVAEAGHFRTVWTELSLAGSAVGLEEVSYSL